MIVSASTRRAGGRASAPLLGTLVAGLLLALLLAGVARAAEVRVFLPREQGMSATELRAKTLALGFQEGVYQTALKLLPQALPEERAALLREVLDPAAERYVLGYKELAVTPDKDGLHLVVDVNVDRRGLRTVLQQMGLFHTLGAPVEANVVTEPTLTDADLQTLAKLETLTGIRPSAAPYPELRIGREADGHVRGVLHAASGNWSALDTDVRTVWMNLWERYFAGVAASGSDSRTEVLSVRGWFAPDGATEFDSELRGWDALLRDVRLIDMNLATEGVSARWALGVTDRAALIARLNAYLPSRGLSYRLSGGQP